MECTPYVGKNQYSKKLALSLVQVYDNVKSYTQENIMRTNVVINEALMHSALTMGGLETKRATIEAALQLFVQLHQQATIRQFRGKLKWHGNLEKMRTNQ